MLIDKLGFHVFLIVVFALCSSYVVVVNPHSMGTLDWILIALAALILGVSMAGYKLSRTYQAKLTWCRWGVPASYFVLAGFYGATFAVNAFSGGIGKGFAVAALILLGMVVAVAGLARMSSRTGPPSAAIGAGSVVATAWLSGTGNEVSFVVMVFAPMIAAVSILLGVIAWRDADK